MMKACSRCGKIHASGFRCNHNRVNEGGAERQLRNLAAWHRKSAEIRERSQYLCAVCREEGVYTYDGLEVHHIEKLKDAPDKLLEDSNLICLCTQHHKAADAGEIDAALLQRLAKKRDARKYPPTP